MAAPLVTARRRPDAAAIAWATLFGAGVALEARALASEKSEDTLSRQVWEILDWGDEHAPAAANLARVFLVGGGVWLGLHFAFKL